MDWPKLLVFCCVLLGVLPNWKDENDGVVVAGGGFMNGKAEPVFVDAAGCVDPNMLFVFCVAVLAPNGFAVVVFPKIDMITCCVFCATVDE